jgi:hypothetical protein
MTGKCPSCGNGIASLRGSNTDVTFPGGTFKTIVFLCPACTAVLGAQIDPIAVKTDIINGVVEQLMKALRK